MLAVGGYRVVLGGRGDRLPLEGGHGLVPARGQIRQGATRRVIVGLSGLSIKMFE